MYKIMFIIHQANRFSISYVPGFDSIGLIRLVSPSKFLDLSSLLVMPIIGAAPHD